MVKLKIFFGRMRDLSIQESVSLLIQKVEDSSVSREEIKMTIMQLHDCNEELRRYSVLNEEANETIKKLKKHISAQDAQMKELLGMIIK